MAASDAKTLKLAINNSITQYKDIIYKDLNLSLRIQDGEKFHKTRILKWDKDQIIFDAPLFQRDWVLFPVPCTLEVSILTKNALYMTTLDIFDKRRKGDGLQYKSRIASPIEKKQQRSHFRLNVTLPVTYTLIPDHVNQHSNAPDQTVYDAISTNISAGGLCMVCKHQLKAETGVYLKLQFLDQSLDLTGTVLIDGDQIPTGFYSHRIRFNGLDTSTENLLSKLILEKQRLMLARPAQPLR
ncbi:MAG: flagellar brake protein [Cellulosilyticaceae bacterium]